MEDPNNVALLEWRARSHYGYTREPSRQTEHGEKTVRHNLGLDCPNKRTPPLAVTLAEGLQSCQRLLLVVDRRRLELAA